MPPLAASLPRQDRKHAKHAYCESEPDESLQPRAPASPLPKHVSTDRAHPPSGYKDPLHRSKTAPSVDSGYSSQTRAATGSSASGQSSGKKEDAVHIEARIPAPYHYTSRSASTEPKKPKVPPVANVRKPTSRPPSTSNPASAGTCTDPKCRDPSCSMANRRGPPPPPPPIDTQRRPSHSRSTSRPSPSHVPAYYGPHGYVTPVSAPAATPRQPLPSRQLYRPASYGSYGASPMYGWSAPPYALAAPSPSHAEFPPMPDYRYRPAPPTVAPHYTYAQPAPAPPYFQPPHERVLQFQRQQIPPPMLPAPSPLYQQGPPPLAVARRPSVRHHVTDTAAIARPRTQSMYADFSTEAYADDYPSPNQPRAEHQIPLRSSSRRYIEQDNQYSDAEQDYFNYQAASRPPHPQRTSSRVPRAPQAPVPRQENSGSQNALIRQVSRRGNQTDRMDPSHLAHKLGEVEEYLNQVSSGAERPADQRRRERPAEASSKRRPAAVSRSATVDVHRAQPTHSRTGSRTEVPNRQQGGQSATQPQTRSRAGSNAPSHTATHTDQTISISLQNSSVDIAGNTEAHPVGVYGTAENGLYLLIGSSATHREQAYHRGGSSRSGGSFSERFLRGAEQRASNGSSARRPAVPGEGAEARALRGRSVVIEGSDEEDS